MKENHLPQRGEPKQGDRTDKKEMRLRPSTPPTHHAQTSATGTRTWVARVRAEYPNQLDYSGSWRVKKYERQRLVTISDIAKHQVSDHMRRKHGEEEDMSKASQGHNSLRLSTPAIPTPLLVLPLLHFSLLEEFRHRDSNPGHSGEGRVS